MTTYDFTLHFLPCQQVRARVAVRVIRVRVVIGVEIRVRVMGFPPATTGAYRTVQLRGNSWAQSLNMTLKRF